MTLSESHRRTAIQALLVFGVWTFLAAFSSSQAALYLAQRGEPIVWRDLLAGRFADWYSCALFTPIFFWMARRYPIDRQSWKLTVPLTLAVTSTCVVVKYAILVPIEHWMGLSLQSTVAGALSRNFANESMAFWAVIGVVHALEYNRRYREREVAAADLRARLSQAQLDALRAQIHPHFLFNTLHSISTLMHRDVAAADTMLTRLSDLLRLTMKHRSDNEITLREELALVDNYIEIMRVRFGDRVTITRNVEREALDVFVPQFILQPLVENAFDHGIARTPGASSIAINAVRSNGHLELSVSDDGRGTSDSTTDGNKNGIGLTNTRLRLEQLYGSAQSMSLERLADRGTRVAIAVPWRMAAVAETRQTSMT
jgi:two-component system, LytTR family, sensor kinase